MLCVDSHLNLYTLVPEAALTASEVHLRQLAVAVQLRNIITYAYVESLQTLGG